uniref:Uncharacterized protein n=1 Tax=Strongyloides venezuelensis TaxID=75913 RepID=A0A0K0FKG6_STRVS
MVNKRRYKHNIVKPTTNNLVINNFNQAQKNVLNLISSGPGSKLPHDHNEHVMCKFNDTFNQSKTMNLNYITKIELNKTNNCIPIENNTIVNDSLSSKDESTVPLKKRGRPKGSKKDNVRVDIIKNIPQITVSRKKRGRPRKNQTIKLPKISPTLSIDSSVKILKIENQSLICHIDDYHPIIALKEVQNSNTISESV